MKKLFILFLLAALPLAVSANGGDQRAVENKYFVSLSRAPFTPRVGVKTSFLASFVDIQKNKLIVEDLIVRVRIAKQGDVRNNIFLFEQKDIKVRGGVLELPYTFTDSGFHEIFFDFAFVSNPLKIYEVPDFLIDVQGAGSNNDGFINQLLFLVSGLVIGFILGKFVKWSKY